MKNLHSELTRKVLADPKAKEAFIRSIHGNPREVIPVGNKKYRLVRNPRQTAPANNKAG